jgi:hypothetical protein
MKELKFLPSQFSQQGLCLSLPVQKLLGGWHIEVLYQGE